MHELDLLALVWRRKQEREDRRASMGAWLLANINRDTKSEPLSLEEIVEWLGHGFQRRAQPPPAVPDAPPDVEELKRRLAIVKQLHDATQARNGVRDEDVRADHP